MTELLTPADISAQLKIPAKTLADWRSKKTGPTFYKIGNHIRYKATDIEAWLATRKS